MRIRLTVLLLVCIGFKLLGVVLFLRGFLAVKKSVDGHATFADQPRSPFEDSSDLGYTIFDVNTCTLKSVL